MKKLSLLLAAGVLSIASMGTQAAVIASAQIVDLYSATFDGPLTPDASLFFGGDPDLNPRAIAVTSLGSGSGTIEFDGTTLTTLDILLPDMNLVISGTTNINTDSAGSPMGIFANVLGTPATDNTPGFAGFQVEGAPATIVDFVTFTDIVDPADPAECTGPLCALIGILSLDGVRYQLDGVVTPLGGDNLLLTVQTGNNSIYEIAITTAVVPVPAAVWLFGSALGLLGWVRRRVA